MRQLLVIGELVGENRLDHTAPQRFSSYAGMDVGRDNGEVVSPPYRAKAPFAFTGKIHAVVSDLK
jgi:arylsulfatase